MYSDKKKKKALLCHTGTEGLRQANVSLELSLMRWHQNILIQSFIPRMRYWSKVSNKRRRFCIVCGFVCLGNSFPAYKNTRHQPLAELNEIEEIHQEQGTQIYSYQEYTSWEKNRPVHTILMNTIFFFFLHSWKQKTKISNKNAFLCLCQFAVSTVN